MCHGKIKIMYDTIYTDYNNNYNSTLFRCRKSYKHHTLYTLTRKLENIISTQDYTKTYGTIIDNPSLDC